MRCGALTTSNITYVYIGFKHFASMIILQYISHHFGYQSHLQWL